MGFVLSPPSDWFDGVLENMKRRRAPLIDRGLVPTRWGYDVADRTSPFVESRLDSLYAFYPAYQSQPEYQEFVAYSDIALLQQQGQGFQSGIDVSQVRLKIDSMAYSLPTRLLRHGVAGFDLFKALGRIRKDPQTGEDENNQSARICNWITEDSVLRIQLANYKDQIATNLTLDWASGLVDDVAGRTVRSHFEPPQEGRLPLLSQSRLANTLGVAVMLMTADGRKVLPIRGSQQAVMSEGKGKFHCSASGVFEWKHLAAWSSSAPFDALLAGMIDEIRTELNLPRQSYQVVPLAMARELPRGGKPQLFCAAQCDLRLAEIQDYMKSAPEKWEFVDSSMLPDDSELRPFLDAPDARVQRDRASLQTYFTYEGWMALRLCEAFQKNQRLF